MKKKLLSAVLALCMVGSAGSIAMTSALPVNAAASASYYIPKNYDLNVPTKEQIIEKYNELLFDIGQNISYEQKYSFKNPFLAGEVGKSDKLNALNVLNFCRYIVGLPDDVELNEDYSADAQAVAYLNAFNANTVYWQQQKDNFPNMLYDQAVKASHKTVIGTDCDNMADAVLSCWTTDLYDQNIQGAGYKFMALSPKMQAVGFGQVDNQYAIYTYDRSRKDNFVGDYVMWPAKNAPYELFKNGTFALNLGDGYGMPTLSGVTVDITSTKTGDHWHFSGADVPEGCHMSVHQDSYNECPCVIFSVDSKFSCDDVVKVKVMGISKNGRSVTVDHTVNFFSLSSVTLNTEEITLGEGESYQLESDIFTVDTRNNNSVSYTSDNTEIASVTESGLITANQAGTAEITAHLPNGQTAVCTVTVKKPPESVAFSKSVIGVFTNEIFDLTPLVTTSKGSASFHNTYTSSNTKVCTVDENGRVTGIGMGTAIVTVTTYNGQTAKIQVITTKLPTLVNNSALSKETVIFGDTIDVNASASGGAGGFTYQVAYRKVGTENWTAVQKYSKNTKVTITPKAVTDYEVRVNAKDSKGNIIEKILPFTVKRAFANTTVMTTDTILFGESITINASAEGGNGSYKYAVLYKKVSDTSWTVVQGYKENNTIIVKPKVATDYNLCVKVMDEDGMIAKNYFNFTVEYPVEPELTNQSVISAEEIQFGETVTVNASAEGGNGAYTYAVLYKKASDTSWTVVQGYRENATIVVKPKAATDYNLCVKVMDGNGTIVKKFFDFKVNGGVTNQSTLSAYEIRLGETVTTSNIGQGGTAPYTYAVLYRKASDTNWIVVQNYTSSTETAITPKAVADYEVCVKIKDVSNTVSKKYMTFRVNG